MSTEANLDEKAYKAVRDAADILTYDDTRDSWGLADAVLAAVPAKSEGRPRKTPHVSGEFSVSDKLVDLAHRLEMDGAVKPDGEAYTSDGLKHLRDQAAAWPPDQRHPEASFRTHGESSPKTRSGQTLAALCAVARGEQVRRPGGLDANAWETAVKQVQTSKRKKWLVTANALRIALGNKPNVPGRIPVQSANDKADQVKALLQEPEVAAAINRSTDAKEKAAFAGVFITDDESANEVVKNQGEATRFINRAQKRATVESNRQGEEYDDDFLKQRNEPLWNQTHFEAALNHINSSRYQMGRAMEEIAIVKPLTAIQQDDAKIDLGSLFDAYGWLESAINDSTQSFEDHIAKIMEGAGDE